MGHSGCRCHSCVGEAGVHFHLRRFLQLAPSTDVVVWVDLPDPTSRNAYTGSGTETVPSGCAWWLRSPAYGHGPADRFRDGGLAGKKGSFTALAWNDKESAENPLRRGFLRATANGHALETADGTPFFVIGDTWWAAGTNRFRWYDDDQERPLGPTAGFKDYVRLRKAQGYNWINVIAAFPTG